MSKNTLRWIIALMSVALMGLVAFQLYWIDAVIEVNQERFRKDVQTALTNAVDKLERQEAMLVAFDNFNSNIKFRSVTPMAPGNVRYIESTYKKWEVKSGEEPVEASQKIKKLPYGVQYQFESNEGDNIYVVQDTSVLVVPSSPGDGFSGFTFTSEIGDSTHFAVGQYKKTIQKAAQKTEMIQVALHELLFEKPTISNRIDPHQLDSLLASELENKGINTEYDYSIVDEESGKIVLASTNYQPKTGRHTEFRASLFPNDLLGEGSTLLISFPNQKSFLLQKIWTSMASSAVLLVTIIFCFGYAVQTIIKQKKISEIKNDFINNMTHEFKTPISTVALACEALQDEQVAVQPTFQKRYLKIISEENKRLGLQVEKVLQMAALDRKDFKLKLESVDINDLIEKAIDNVVLQVQKRNGTIATEMKANPAKIPGDQMHLTNIIHNLLDNANKYSPEDPEILVKTSNSKNGIVITVEDHGLGMSKESAQKIFDRFYRVPTGNLHDVKGFGLGLAYVKTMVEAHGGTIEVKSELKKGSTFEIHLPYGSEA
ncbi:MAG: HAMP domain-containing sensor histidine kinase [Imperialibacter sp.]|uniref:sensor histidine kinase n=1 Tax=Imperialibacter sp. TaxID=2038411 RepID=UPI0032F05D96